MKDILVFSRDGACWMWHWKSFEDEEGHFTKYWTTSLDGDGIFFVDLKSNERLQLLGTADFSLNGVKDPKAKIRRWMN